MEVDFDLASRTLRRLALPPFPAAANVLAGLVRTAHILDAFRQCFPEKTPDTGPLCLFDLDGERLLALQQEAIAAVSRLFPVLDEHMDMLVQEGEPLTLHPDSCGFAWDDEWLNEIYRDPSQLPPDSDLAMFFKTLWIASTQFSLEGGQWLWEAVQGRFDYPCNLPEVDIRPGDFNWEAFFILLEGEKLGDFQRAVRVSLCDTGNPFLDVTPEEYGCGMVELPDFTTENIQELQRLWAEAEAWLAGYERCRERVLADPGLYTRLAELWKLAWAAHSSPAKKQTLIEIPGGDHNDSD